ncbi:hypothetical protein BKA93DRAFT_490664 [Sparassis latifolia]
MNMFKRFFSKAHSNGYAALRSYEETPNPTQDIHLPFYTSLPSLHDPRQLPAAHVHIDLRLAKSFGGATASDKSFVVPPIRCATPQSSFLPSHIIPEFIRWETIKSGVHEYCRPIGWGVVVVLSCTAVAIAWSCFTVLIGVLVFQSTHSEPYIQATGGVFIEATVGASMLGGAAGLLLYSSYQIVVMGPERRKEESRIAKLYGHNLLPVMCVTLCGVGLAAQCLGMAVLNGKHSGGLGAGNALIVSVVGQVLSGMAVFLGTLEGNAKRSYRL